MRLRSFTLTFFLLLGTLAGAQQIRDLDIKAVLLKDGSAEITQVWDVLVTDGTEWYVPVGNLGKMQITDFSVSENNSDYIAHLELYAGLTLFSVDGDTAGGTYVVCHRTSLYYPGYLKELIESHDVISTLPLKALVSV